MQKGSKVTLNGWVKGYRNLGGVLFLDLRDRYGITQIAFHPETIDSKMLADAERTRNEFVVAVRGEVVERPDGTINPKLKTGEIEVVASEYYILSESKTPPFEIDDNCNANEPAHLFFVMAAPPYDDSLYLKIFKALSEMLRQESFRQELMAIDSPGEIIRAIRAME